MNPSEKITTTFSLTAGSFGAEVLTSMRPVLVAFLATWSRPCQVLVPILAELARDWTANVKVANINADDALDLSLCYDIQSIPTLLYFVEGKVRVRIVGTATKEAILAKLKASGFADHFDTFANEPFGGGAAAPQPD